MHPDIGGVVDNERYFDPNNWLAPRGYHSQSFQGHSSHGALGSHIHDVLLV